MAVTGHFPMPERAARSERRPRPAHRPHQQGAARASAAAPRATCGWSAATCRASTPRSSRPTATGSCATSGSRYGTYVNGEADHRAQAGARRSGPVRPRQRRRRRVPDRRRRRRTPIDRTPARSTTCASSRRCSKACARSARAGCSTRCWRWCSTRRSRWPAPSAASSCCAGRRQGTARNEAGARQGPHHAARQPLQHQPQDSRGGVRDRRAEDRRGPARRRSRQRAHGHGGARHPPRRLHSAAHGPLPRSRRT